MGFNGARLIIGLSTKVTSPNDLNLKISVQKKFDLKVSDWKNLRDNLAPGRTWICSFDDVSSDTITVAFGDSEPLSIYRNKCIFLGFKDAETQVSRIFSVNQIRLSAISV